MQTGKHEFFKIHQLISFYEYENLAVSQAVTFSTLNLQYLNIQVTNWAFPPGYLKKSTQSWCD